MIAVFVLASYLYLLPIYLFLQTRHLNKVATPAVSVDPPRR